MPSQRGLNCLFSLHIRTISIPCTNPPSQLVDLIHERDCWTKEKGWKHTRVSLSNAPWFKGSFRVPLTYTGLKRGQSLPTLSHFLEIPVDEGRAVPLFTCLKGQETHLLKLTALNNKRQITLLHLLTHVLCIQFFISSPHELVFILFFIIYSSACFVIGRCCCHCCYSLLFCFAIKGALIYGGRLAEPIKIYSRTMCLLWWVTIHDISIMMVVYRLLLAVVCALVTRVLQHQKPGPLESRSY